MIAIWIILWLASLALVGWRAYRRGRAFGHDDGWHTGYDAGQKATEAQTLIDLDVMLRSYPTSRGLRAAIRALGGSVPPLPRRKGAK